MQLIRLDRELTGELLLRHPEKFSVPSVVGQLKGRRDLQHWYLGLLFARSPETYGAQEYAPFHALQVRVPFRFLPRLSPGWRGCSDGDGTLYCGVSESCWAGYTRGFPWLRRVVPSVRCCVDVSIYLRHISGDVCVWRGSSRDKRFDLEQEQIHVCTHHGRVPRRGCTARAGFVVDVGAWLSLDTRSRFISPSYRQPSPSDGRETRNQCCIDVPPPPPRPRLPAKVSLLAEFAAPFERGRPPAYNSAFLRFLRGSGFAPLEAALRECGKRRPPLYDEMAYILGRMGDSRRALTILLEVCLMGWLRP